MHSNDNEPVVKPMSEAKNVKLEELCQKTGCMEVAGYYPKVMVPVLGFSLDAEQPLGLIVGLPLCKKHCAEFEVNGFLEQTQGKGKLKNVFILGARQYGLEPDFDRSYVHCLPIDSDEAEAFRRT